MSTHNEIVTYAWTEFDRMGLSSPLEGTTVTPYQIPPARIAGASDLQDGDLVQVSLGSSNDPPTIARFYRNGYAWVPLPPEVPVVGMLIELFAALFAFDPVQFAHFDPALNVVSNVGRDVQSLQSAPRTFGIPLPDASTLPFGDLAQLHFEYWGNTLLRAAVYRATATDETFDVLGITDVNIPVFGSNPITDFSSFMSGPLASLLPQTIPCQKDDAQIQFVLARCPVEGGTVRVPPSRQPTDLPIVVYSIEPPRIELDGWAKQTLAPLFVNQWNTRASNVRFRITLPSPSVLTRIEILLAGEVYYSETQTVGEFLIPGMHIWTWDGYDDHGVLDTIVLKRNTLQARVTTTDIEGRIASSSTDLGTGCEKLRWLDARVDLKGKHVDCTVFQKYSNPSDVDLLSLNGAIGSILGGALPGLGSGLPSLPSLPSLPGMSSLPSLDDMKANLTIPPIFDLDPALFAVFKNQIKNAIDVFLSRDEKSRTVTFGHSWALTGYTSTEPNPETAPVGPKETLPASVLKNDRDPKDQGLIYAQEQADAEAQGQKNSTAVVTVPTGAGKNVHIDGAVWTVTTSCQERSTDYLHTLLCMPFPNAVGELGIHIPGGELPHGMLSRSMNLAFMEGIPIIDIWNDLNYKYNAVVGAHEVGHTVLRDCKNIIYSITHKGSSDMAENKGSFTPTFAQQLAGFHGSPPSKEYDVMLYYEEIQPDPPPGNEKKFLAPPIYGPDGQELTSKDKPAQEVYFPDDYWERTTAVEEDVLGLVSMAKVTFG